MFMCWGEGIHNQMPPIAVFPLFSLSSTPFIMSVYGTDALLHSANYNPSATIYCGLRARLSLSMDALWHKEAWR